MTNYLGYDRFSVPQLFCIANDASGSTQNYGVQHTGQGIFFYYDISGGAQPVAYTPAGIYSQVSIPYYTLDASNNTTSTCAIGGGINLTAPADSNTNAISNNSMILTDGANSTSIYANGNIQLHSQQSGQTYDIDIMPNGSNEEVLTITTQVTGNPANTWFIANAGSQTLVLEDGTKGTLNHINMTNSCIESYNSDTLTYIGYSSFGNATGLQVQQGTGGDNFVGISYDNVSCIDNAGGVYSSVLGQQSLQFIDTGTITAGNPNGITNTIGNPTGMYIDNISGALTINGNFLTNGIATIDMSIDITSFNFSTLLVGGSYYIRVYNNSSGNIKIYANSTGSNTNFSWGNGTNTSFFTLAASHIYGIQIYNTGVGYNAIGTQLQPNT